MTKIFACERWYDDTWWETEAPDDWNFRQDKTIKNWPHIFESPSGSKLTVWASKHVKVDRAAWQPPLPIELKTEGERTAYQLAELPGSHAGVSQLEKRALGRLVGFTRKTTASNSIGWTGFFMSEPWMISAQFEPGPTCHEDDEGVASSILASLQFRA